MLTRSTLKTAKRIVVKIGTSTLTDDSGHLNNQHIRVIARELTLLRKAGKEIVLVTSAAISAGVERMGLNERPTTIPDKQAAAAVGQGILMQTYEKLFSEYDQIVGQILMTREDTVKRSRYTNIRNTFIALFEHEIIPIINENDAVAIDEIKIGDNDTLSAQVASIIDADLLIILSDIDGLYSDNPSNNPSAKLIYEVPVITDTIEKAAGGAGSKQGTGGMMTKIQAAKIVVNSGIAMIIASGKEKNIFTRLLAGENIGTLFLASRDRLQFRKRWLAFGARIKGKLYIDDGCFKALQGGSSLLPAGIVKTEGEYGSGATLSISDIQGREIARGLSNYSSQEIEKIKGVKTAEIEKHLGNKPFDEVIHRDNLVLMTGGHK